MAKASNSEGLVERLPIALRAFTERPSARPRGRTPGAVPWPQRILVLDFETTTDETQRMLFGSYRYIRTAGYRELRLMTVEEGLICADDLADADLAILREYVKTRQADVIEGVEPKLHLYSASEFLERVFWRAAAKNPGRDGLAQPAAVVGFNLPFDLSRLASAVSRARGGRTKAAQRNSAMAGGFSFSMFRHEDENGELREHQYRPRVAIKTIDSKRHLVGLVPPGKIDDPDTFDNGFRGHFLDLRTLAFALTDRSYSLSTACESWGVEHPKTEAAEHGRVTPEYVDYNRRDVQATAELYGKLIEDLRTHPISLQPSRAYSPASLGKAYLQAMGIRPLLERQPDFPKEVLGWAMTAYYGGRAECRIRRTPMPVVYLDFLAMYPTVNALMGLWDLVCSERIEVIEATDDVRAMLDEITLDDCFDPERWKDFPGLVLIEPDGDVLPVRSRYAHSPNPTWQIGVNPLTSDQALWYSIPDAVAASLLSGKPPRVAKAIRFEASEAALRLTKTSLRSEIEIDPANEDFFRSVIEERKRLGSDPESKRLGRFLKILANAASYGVYAEMVRHEMPAGSKDEVTVRGLDGPFTASLSTPEEPGQHCFPPMAALITGAARLQLALLERSVTDAGGSYVFCDTDSMAIVATEAGGLVPCEGGAHDLDGAEAVRALGWTQVDEIQARFDSLNPYSPSVGCRVLEIESENYADKAETERRQIYCLAISAKRYALYSLDDAGLPQLRRAGPDDDWQGEKWSEHGLGHLLSPVDLKFKDREWIRELWELEIRRTLNLPADEPDWLDLPALGRVSVTKPHVYRAFRTYNDGKPYADQVKPFNFMLAAHLSQFGLPREADPTAFQLIAPFEDDRSKWGSIRWINRDSPTELYEARTKGPPEPGVPRISAFHDVLSEYRVHPEAKSLAPDGGRSAWHSQGVLRRRPIVADRVIYIGKESNEFEDGGAGLVHDGDGVSIYGRRDEWEETRQVLRAIPRQQLIAASGIDRSLMHRYVNGAVTPRADRRDHLGQIAVRFRARLEADP